MYSATSGAMKMAMRAMPTIQNSQKKTLPAKGSLGSGPMWLNVFSRAVSGKVIAHG